MLKGTRAHDFYSTWDSSIDEDMLDLQLQGLEAVSAAPASISQGVAQVRAATRQIFFCRLTSRGH